MTWTPMMRALLALALVQVLLGVGLAVSGPGENGVSVDDPDGAPAGEVPGPPATPGESPGSPADGTPPDPPGVPPPSGVPPEPTDPAIPPTAAGSRAPAALPIHGTYEQLKPQEQRDVASDPPYQPMVEGRVVDRTYWRVSAYRQPTGGICFETATWDPATSSGGSGGGGQADCKSNTEWDWGGTSSGERYVALVGYAPADAHEIELVTKDGRRGRVGGVFQDPMGVSFFAAWMECGGSDLDRFDALDRAGKVLSTYSFEDFPEGMPSWFCDFLKESG